MHARQTPWDMGPLSDSDYRNSDSRQMARQMACQNSGDLTNLTV